jgi:hypothetical protein
VVGDVVAIVCRINSARIAPWGWEMKSDRIVVSVSASVVLALLTAAPQVAQADSLPRTHDGFQFQVTGGLGFYDSSASQGGSDASMSGMTLPGSVLMGGSLFPGFVIGGGLVLDYAPSPAFEQNGMSVATGGDVTQYIVGLGVYADYYLDAQKNGLHFQGFAGWGGLETSVSGNAGGSDPTGLVAHLGVGYEWWLSDQWSGGLMARVLFAPLDLNGVSYTTFEPALVGSLTWH